MLIWPQLPTAWLGLWTAEDGRCLFIEKRFPARYLVTSAQSVSGPYHERSDLTQKNIPTVPAFEMLARLSNSAERGWILVAEAGHPNLGPTFHLAFRQKASGSAEPAVPARANMPIEEIVVVTGVGIGLYDDWEDDFGVPWAFPPATFGKAAAEIEAAFLTFHKQKTKR